MSKKAGEGFAAFALAFVALALQAANPFTNTVTSVHCETPGGAPKKGRLSVAGAELRFGCGPQSLRFRYWLRNATLLRARKTIP